MPATNCGSASAPGSASSVAERARALRRVVAEPLDRRDLVGVELRGLVLHALGVAAGEVVEVVVHARHHDRDVARAGEVAEHLGGAAVARPGRRAGSGGRGRRARAACAGARRPRPPRRRAGARSRAGSPRRWRGSAARSARRRGCRRAPAARARAPRRRSGSSSLKNAATAAGSASRAITPSRSSGGALERLAVDRRHRRARRSRRRRSGRSRRTASPAIRCAGPATTSAPTISATSSSMPTYSAVTCPRSRRSMTPRVPRRPPPRQRPQDPTSRWAGPGQQSAHARRARLKSRARGDRRSIRACSNGATTDVSCPSAPPRSTRARRSWASSRASSPAGRSSPCCPPPPRSCCRR